MSLFQRQKTINKKSATQSVSMLELKVGSERGKFVTCANTDEAYMSLVFLTFFPPHTNSNTHEHKSYSCNQSHPMSHLHLHALFMVQELEL